jgi:hypothetical protein
VSLTASLLLRFCGPFNFSSHFPFYKSLLLASEIHSVCHITDSDGSTDKFALKNKKQQLSLAQKEKLYLDCCAAFNVDKSSLVTDDEFEQVGGKTTSKHLPPFFLFFVSGFGDFFFFSKYGLCL